MSSLIIMVTWDTQENERSEYTSKSLASLTRTVDFTRHRMVIVDNGSDEESLSVIRSWAIMTGVTVVENGENLGTSVALNKGLRMRNEGEHCIKIDGDMVIHDVGWVDKLESVIDRCPEYGIVGLKRKDLAQSPNTTNETFRSSLRMLPHEPGQTWIVVEEHHDIIGSCTMFNSALIDKIGYSYQMGGKYGFEDNLYSIRSIMVGFRNCFLFHVEVDHIDRGGGSYGAQKEAWANEKWAEYQKMHTQYQTGERSIYYDGN